MDDIYFRLLLGHMVGDYLLQSTMMATTKGQSKTWQGWAWCFLHSVIYTAAICVFLWNFDSLFFLLIFNSHFWIDKFSLAEKWGQLTGGRTFAKAAAEPDEAKRPFSIAFTCLVYVAVDNTMHLLLMWGILKWLVV